MDSLSPQLLGGGLNQRPGRERARRPRPPARDGPPRRPSGDLHQGAPAGPAQRAGARREEGEALLGHRAGPAPEGLQRGIGHRAAAERALAGRAGGAHRVDRETHGTQLVLGALQGAAQVVGVGGVGAERQSARVAHPRQGVLAAGQRRHPPAVAQQALGDRAAEVAGAQDQRHAVGIGGGHGSPAGGRLGLPRPRRAIAPPRGPGSPARRRSRR